MSADTVGPVLDGEQDVWLAACAGFHSSPFAEPGSPCAQPFWGCLDCPNAVITARKLPAILAFLAFVEEQRCSLPASDWAAKFGRVHTRSEEHTSELQSLMRISYAVFCLKKQNTYIFGHIKFINTSTIHTLHP